MGVNVIWHHLNSICFVTCFACRALDKNEYNHITATYFLLAERRLKIARQEQSHSVSGANSGKNSPKKSSGDVVDGSTEISACNLLAPPTNYYNSSRTDGITTTVSRPLPAQSFDFHFENKTDVIFVVFYRRVERENVALSKRKMTTRMKRLIETMVH